LRVRLTDPTLRMPEFIADLAMRVQCL